MAAKHELSVIIDEICSCDESTEVVRLDGFPTGDCNLELVPATFMYLCRLTTINKMRNKTLRNCVFITTFAISGDGASVHR